MKKFQSEIIPDKHIVDDYTGELKEFVITKVITPQEFIAFFLRSVPEFVALDGNSMRLFTCCWQISSFNKEYSEEGNVIYTNSIFKQKVRELGVDMNNATIDNYISKLARKGFLIRLCKGSYMLNPNICFKGTIKDASRLQMKVMTSNYNNNEQEK